MTPPFNNKPYSDGYAERIKKISDRQEFNRLFRVIKKSIPTIIGLLTLCAILAFAMLRWTNPRYESSSIVQIGQNDKANKLLAVDQFFEEDDFFSELEFIHSHLLIAHTVRNLPLKVRYFTEGKILSHEKYPNSSYSIDSIKVHNNAIYGKKIFVEFNNPSSSTFDITINDTKYSSLQINYKHNLPDFSFYLTKNIEQLKPENIDENYFSIYTDEMLINEFSENLQVSAYNSRAKSILIKSNGNNPKLVSDFVNQHVKSYIDYGKEKQNQSAENILSFITSQLDTVSKNLHDAERLLASFKSKNNFTGQISPSIFDNIDEFDNDLVEIEYQESILKELNKITSDNNDNPDIYGVMSQIIGSSYESVLKKIIDDFTQLLKQREQLKRNITEENETIKTLDYQIETQRKLIKRSVESLTLRLHKKKELINKKKRLAEKQFISIPAKEVELARYQRLFNISEKYYNLLLEKRTEYNISKAGYVTNVKILTTANPDFQPVTPKKYVIYTSFLGFGLILSIIYLLLKYLSYDKIQSLSDITKFSGASIQTLGIVPKWIDSKSALVIHRKSKTIFAESLRAIKTNLPFIKKVDGAKTIALTSTISGEGKTFLSINLGGILSLSNKKVILLDLDFRKPKIHDSFGVNNDKGLSDILNENADISTCIHKSSLDNFDFITAGTTPPNPHELINNGQLSAVINELKKHYEYIVFDTPPIGLVTDSFPLLQMVDYPIYVFKSNVSRLSFIHNVDRLYHENNIKNISTILNNVEINRDNYGYVSFNKDSFNYFEKDSSLNKTSWWSKITSFF